MKELSRRDFLKNAIIGGAVLGLGNIVIHAPMNALASGKFDMGLCKSVRIKCICELPCIDADLNSKTINDAGGGEVNQWTIPWVRENAAGNCTLIDMETLEGIRHKFLLDAGGDGPYMDKCFKREGIDNMLKSGEIEFLFITHEHPDHLWGLEAVLKYNPAIRIFIPDTFYSEGMCFLEGAQYIKPSAVNLIPHRGELLKLSGGQIHKLYEGCAAVDLDVPLPVRARGEALLYFNIKDKGIIYVTGCGHPGVLTLAEFARKNFAGGENLYGIYGGLHISFFGGMDAEKEKLVRGMADYHFKKIACNHCTGVEAVKRMIELEYPIVRGTARYGSWTDLYVGNGDEVVFG
jgi:7,8-dihydropterin-6-yl-methyl-4-(beta-D-ribofuranosyl)aminobenzene 5'-phosphate synthase